MNATGQTQDKRAIPPLPSHVLAKIWLTSFADKRLNVQLNRLGQQAIHFGFSRDHILLWNEDALANSFKAEMRTHLIPGSRGFGYWCWKPQVVLQAFELMCDGDFLLFLDAGCHLNRTAASVRRFMDYLDTTDKFGLCNFQSKSLMASPYPDLLHHYLLERQWTKGDVFDYFHCRDNPHVTDTGQLAGGVFFVKKTKENVLFFEQYRNVFLHNFHLADDSPSLASNLDGFVENRHDQSIFSIMCKLRWNGVNTYSTMEFVPILYIAPAQFRNDSNWGTASWRQMRIYPIHARRDKRIGWKSLLPITIFNFLQRIYSKILNMRILQAISSRQSNNF